MGDLILKNTYLLSLTESYLDVCFVVLLNFISFRVCFFFKMFIEELIAVFFLFEAVKWVDKVA